MRFEIHLPILFLATVLNAELIYAQQANAKDPCNELRFLALMNEAPTIDATDVRKLPQASVANSFGLLASTASPLKIRTYTILPMRMVGHG